MTYQALVCERLSDDLSGLCLRELERTPLGPGEVRVGIRAAGLNFPDLLMTQGKYQFKPELPFVPGMEGAGVVLETGSRVTGWQPGDAVRFGGKQGAFAEEIVVDAASLRPVRPELSMEEAASFGATGITAWVALNRIGKLRRNETLLVHGARGGVGSACVQLGLHLGARVIATASNPDHLAPLTRQGAIPVQAAPGFRTRVLELTDGRGADVIADPVGGDIFDESVRC
nr:NADPH:quinone oxidoreductase family protein [Pseudomonas sp.]